MKRILMIGIAAALGLSFLTGCAASGGGDSPDGVYDFTFSTNSPRVGQPVTITVDFRGDLANGIYFVVRRMSGSGEFEIVSSETVFGTNTLTFRFPLHGKYQIDMGQAIKETMEESAMDDIVKTIDVPEPTDAGYAALYEATGVWRLSIKDNDAAVSVDDYYMIGGMHETLAGNEDWSQDLYAHDNDQYYDLIIYGANDNMALRGQVWYGLGKCQMKLRRDATTYYHVDFTTALVGDFMKMVPGTTAEVLNTTGDTFVKDADFNQGIMNMAYYLPRSLK